MGLVRNHCGELHAVYVVGMPIAYYIRQNKRKHSYSKHHPLPTPQESEEASEQQEQIELDNLLWLLVHMYRLRLCENIHSEEKIFQYSIIALPARNRCKIPPFSWAKYLLKCSQVRDLTACSASRPSAELSPREPCEHS